MNEFMALRAKARERRDNEIAKAREDYASRPRSSVTCRKPLETLGRGWPSTRITNAHSKSAAHHAAMVAIFVAYYNFCREHESCGDGKHTPGIAAGLADHVWTVRKLLEAACV